MIINLQYQLDSVQAWSVNYILNQLAAKLKAKHPDVDFVDIHSSINQAASFPSPAVMGIINPQNGKRIYVSYLDKNRFMFISHEDYGWNPESMQQIITSTDYHSMIGMVDEYQKSDKDDTKKYCFEMGPGNLYFPDNIRDIMIPASYPVYSTKMDKEISKQIFNTVSSKHREQKLMFRGYMWEPRLKIMEAGQHNQISYSGEGIQDAYKYAEFLIENSVGLSLNGNAEICNRDMEYMSVGIPVIRPKLIHTETMQPLIPDVHYISFDFEREPMFNQIYQSPSKGYDYKIVWDALVDKWESVKNDYDYLDYVAENGKKWYLENASLDVQVDNLLKSINLSLLE